MQKFFFNYYNNKSSFQWKSFLSAFGITDDSISRPFEHCIVLIPLDCFQHIHFHSILTLLLKNAGQQKFKTFTRKDILVL